MRKLVRTGIPVLLFSLFFVLALSGTYLAARQAPTGDDAKRFIGTWRAANEAQIGVMIYDNLGNMAVQVMPKLQRKPFAAAQPTPDEAKAAMNGYLAYFGTYTVDEQAHTITHHRKGALNPGQVGQDAVRHYEFQQGGDRLVLIPVESSNRIIWNRAK